MSKEQYDVHLRVEIESERNPDEIYQGLLELLDDTVKTYADGLRVIDDKVKTKHLYVGRAK